MYKFIFFLFALVLFSQCSSFKPIDSDKESKKVHVDMPDTRASLIYYSRDLIGTKYKYGGTTPRGFDCSGFTQYVYKFRHLELPRNSEAQSKVGDKVKSKNVKPGDLVFFKKGRKVNHVGMVTKIENGEIYMIHSSSSRGIIEESITSSTYWKPKLLYYRSYIDE